MLLTVSPYLTSDRVIKVPPPRILSALQGRYRIQNTVEALVVELGLGETYNMEFG